ncbi:MAG: ATP-grasp fold amidoligase family protein [Candidatus Excrementavichristensenella sp.]|jgi:hypothetical protein
MAQTITERTPLWRLRIFLFSKWNGLARRRMLDWVPDVPFLKIQYFLKLGRRLNLKHPRLYNEKAQWIKLYDRQPIYNIFVDKLAVRDYVKQQVGEQYLIPEIARYQRPWDIQWDKLPQHYVLKCTHGSSCNIIQDGSLTPAQLEQKKARLPGWMASNWFYLSREWPYLAVKPRILVEQFLEGPNGSVPLDYKFLCFDGEPKYVIVDVDRYKDGGDGHRRNFYDLNWVRQDMLNRHPGYDGEVPRPTCLEEMIGVARALSQGIPHIRIDLYEVAGRVYFGEMTFFHGFGMEVFRPRSFEEHLGDLIRLPGEAKHP